MCKSLEEEKSRTFVILLLTPFTHLVMLDVVNGLSFVFEDFLFCCGFIEHGSTC